MFVVEDFCQENKLFRYKNVSSNFMNVVKEASADFFIDKPMFARENFSFYFYDNFVTKLNITENNYINVYIEINQPKNIKTPTTIINKKPKKIKDDKVPDLHLTLKEIKRGLFDQLVSKFGENTMFWREKYYIRMSCIEYYNGEKHNMWFKITPCFTYTNEKGVKGVIYYPQNCKDLKIEYPQVSLANIEKKNIETNGLYKKYVLMFKNIFLKQNPKTEFLPFEVFESILYNVPNNVFTGLDRQSILFVINYIKNKNTSEFISIDEQSSLFFNQYKPMLFTYAKHALNQIANYIKFHI